MEFLFLKLFPFFAWFSISLPYIAEAVNNIPKNITFPAVIMFGDSLVDTGNNNYINTIVKVNYPPYGKDFMGGEPTGRFSNGKVPSDLLGVNFASGCAGYDPLTSDIADLYKLGARRIGIFGLPPLGCLPSQRTLKGGAERECVEIYNKAAQLFNDKLSAELNSVNNRFPDARMIYIDIYNLPLDLITESK
ncbi:hypothetical protein RD792_012295 [Penstemon davidsonii]|uniref:Uncharacterized protein n=1 Tax=Penstemon davidsonii TaxID=160366 RepID=A0ABR0CXD8_9LAMI|nr:hypothetical protein RD792_012295 [Penstemon davidsonii]